MRLPGFTEELSADKSQGHYCRGGTEADSLRASISPAFTNNR